MANTTLRDTSNQEKKYSLADLKEIRKKLTKKVISIPPLYVEITGSLSAGYLLAQISYYRDEWEKKTGNPYFYKTDAKFREELRLGIKEFKAAKKRLVELGLITVTLRGIPAISYYELNDERLINCIISSHEIHPSNEEEQVVPKGNNRSCLNEKEENYAKNEDIPDQPVVLKGTNWLSEKGPATNKTDIIRRNNTPINTPLSVGPKKKTASSLALLEEEEYPILKDEYLEFKEAHPKIFSDVKTYKQFCKECKTSSPQEIIIGAKNYALLCKADKTEKKYIRNSLGWLQDKRWKDPVDTKNLTDSQKSVIYKETGDPQFKSDSDRVLEMFFKK